MRGGKAEVLLEGIAQSVRQGGRVMFITATMSASEVRAALIARHGLTLMQALRVRVESMKGASRW